MLIDINSFLPAGQEQYRFLLEPVVADAARQRDRENRVIKREMTEDELTEKKKKKGGKGDARALALRQKTQHHLLHRQHRVFDPRLPALLKNMAELRRRTHEVGPQLVEFLLLMRRFGLGHALQHMRNMGAITHLRTHLSMMGELGLMPAAVVGRLENVLGEPTGPMPHAGHGPVTRGQRTGQRITPAHLSRVNAAEASAFHRRSGSGASYTGPSTDPLADPSADPSVDPSIGPSIGRERTAYHKGATPHRRLGR